MINDKLALGQTANILNNLGNSEDESSTKMQMNMKDATTYDWSKKSSMIDP